MNDRAEPGELLLLADGTRTTMRYDRPARTSTAHPNYVLAAYMASGSSASPARSYSGETSGIADDRTPGGVREEVQVTLRVVLRLGNPADDRVGVKVPGFSVDQQWLGICKERLDAAISGTIPATPAIAGTEDPTTLGLSAMG
jgi:hypothetical protein